MIIKQPNVMRYVSGTTPPSQRFRQPGSVTTQMDTPAPSPQKLSRLLDRFGALASFVCAVHCALLPLIFGVLPALGLAFLANHAFERTFVFFAIALASVSLIYGWRKHRSFRAFWLLLPGIGLLVASMLMGSDHADPGHAVAVSIGGTLVALSHLMNLRLNHVHGPACNRCPVD